MNLTELDAAERVRNGLFPSPFKFAAMWLVNLRITGTGLAYRANGNEHVWRSPDFYLNNQFLSRCNGLPVITEHTKEKALDEREFSQRIVGTVLLPYIRGDEVWAIARIYPKWVVDEISKGGVSTSPNVLFTTANTGTLVSEGDRNFLIEGVPFLIDHIALVPLGVWDKDGQPKGVEVTEPLSESEKMAAMVKDAVNAAFQAPTAALEALNQRLIAMEQEVNHVR
ncbi:cell envelope biogenesis protein TolA [Klebsiella aerogenes]|uniref:cell envelope biogenesis protein TolA n=1 Tax=Klebsiella aerogenes TaxID=548 RepID=UPI001F1A3BF3|nr:cell envelope biogenesis protein TolA [Klebsiella aerogenes]